jgi:hypothetical protein
MIISRLIESPIRTKRFRAIMDDGRKYDFGLRTRSTYIDHHDTIKRKNYWARHYANSTEKELISNLIPSPALLSAIILWGPYTNIQQNVNFLNNTWKK